MNGTTPNFSPSIAQYNRAIMVYPKSLYTLFRRRQTKYVSMSRRRRLRQNISSLHSRCVHIPFVLSCVFLLDAITLRNAFSRRTAPTFHVPFSHVLCPTPSVIILAYVLPAFHLHHSISALHTRIQSKLRRSSFHEMCSPKNLIARTFIRS